MLEAGILKSQGQHSSNQDVWSEVFPNCMGGWPSSVSWLTRQENSQVRKLCCSSSEYHPFWNKHLIKRMVTPLIADFGWAPLDRSVSCYHRSLWVQDLFDILALWLIVKIRSILVLMINCCYLHYAFPESHLSRQNREVRLMAEFPTKKPHPTECSHYQTSKDSGTHLYPQHYIFLLSSEQRFFICS